MTTELNVESFYIQWGDGNGRGPINGADMGWLRLVGSLKFSLKLLVSSAEYSLFYRALLQKRPII